MTDIKKLASDMRANGNIIAQNVKNKLSPFPDIRKDDLEGAYDNWQSQSEEVLTIANEIAYNEYNQLYSNKVAGLFGRPEEYDANITRVNRFNDFSDYALTIDEFILRIGEEDILVPEFNFLIANMKVDRRKRVIVNELNFSKDSVKEITGASDYKIQIDGFLISENYTEKPDIASFMRVMSADIALPVTSSFLNDMGINYIVITDYNIDSQWKTNNAYPYKFSCLSDNPNAKIIIK